MCEREKRERGEKERKKSERERERERERESIPYEIESIFQVYALSIYHVGLWTALRTSSLARSVLVQ